MKKEVQALINRRRARMVPAILLAVAGLILIGIIVLVALTFANGPGLGLVKTETPAPSATASQTHHGHARSAYRHPEATATETVTPGPSPTLTPVVYTVVAGDSLYTIADQFKANLCTMMIINNITDPSLLTVGQVLIIPGRDTVLPSATPLPTGIARGTVLDYVVQCDDTLVSIASKFNSTAEDIAKTNDLKADAALQIGQVIKVRVNIATPTPTCRRPSPAGHPGQPRPHHDRNRPHDVCTRSAADEWAVISGRAGLLFAREVAYPDLQPSASLAMTGRAGPRGPARHPRPGPSRVARPRAGRLPVQPGRLPGQQRRLHRSAQLLSEPGARAAAGPAHQPVGDLPGGGLAAAIAGGRRGAAGPFHRLRQPVPTARPISTHFTAAAN